MTYADAVRNAMLDLCDESGSVDISKVSLHTADPGTTGANEVAGGSYARQDVTWAAASGGEKASSADVTWNVPADTTIRYVGGWSSTGTWRGGGLLAAAQAFATDGTYTIAAGDLTQTV